MMDVGVSQIGGSKESPRNVSLYVCGWEGGQRRLTVSNIPSQQGGGGDLELPRVVSCICSSTVNYSNVKN